MQKILQFLTPFFIFPHKHKVNLMVVISNCIVVWQCCLNDAESLKFVETCLKAQARAQFSKMFHLLMKKRLYFPVVGLSIWVCWPKFVSWGFKECISFLMIFFCLTHEFLREERDSPTVLLCRVFIVLVNFCFLYFEVYY